MTTNKQNRVISLRQAVTLATHEGMPTSAATLKQYGQRGAFAYDITPGGHWRIPRKAFIQWLTVDRFSKTQTAA
jgi:hypothetical protein